MLTIMVFSDQTGSCRRFHDALTESPIAIEGCGCVMQLYQDMR